MNKKAMMKLAQVRMAINHVLRTRGMMKQALLNEPESFDLDSLPPEPYQYEKQRSSNRPQLPYPLNSPIGIQKNYDEAKQQLQDYRKRFNSSMPYKTISELIPYYMGDGGFPGKPSTYYYDKFDRAKRQLPFLSQYPSLQEINATWRPYYLGYPDWKQRQYEIDEESKNIPFGDPRREELNQESDYIYDLREGLESMLNTYAEQAREVEERRYDSLNEPVSAKTQAMYKGDYNKAVQYARQLMGLKPGQKLWTSEFAHTPAGKMVRSPITGGYRRYYQDAENPMIQDPFRSVPTQEEWDIHHPRMQKQWAKEDAHDLRRQAVRRALSKGINALSKPVVSTFLPTPVQMALPYAKKWDDMEQSYNPGAYNPLNQPKGETEGYLWE